MRTMLYGSAAIFFEAIHCNQEKKPFLQSCPNAKSNLSAVAGYTRAIVVNVCNRLILLVNSYCIVYLKNVILSKA